MGQVSHTQGQKRRGRRDSGTNKVRKTRKMGSLSTMSLRTHQRQGLEVTNLIASVIEILIISLHLVPRRVPSLVRGTKVK